MKTTVFYLSMAVWSASLILSSQAQPFTTLYAFTGLSDGSVPRAGLMLSGSTLYGTASSGTEPDSHGTVFCH